MREMKFLSFSILILAVAVCVILQGVVVSVEGSETIGTQTPFMTFYTDPFYFTDMELDAKYDVVYLGSSYGIIVKDLVDGRTWILDQRCGIKRPSITDLEWDEKGNRLFVATEDERSIYILDTRNLMIIDKISLEGEDIGTFNSIAYDSSKDVLYMSDTNKVFRYWMGDEEFDVIDFSKMESIEKHKMITPFIQKILFSESVQKLVLATNQGLKVIDIENMNLTYSSRFDGGNNNIYDIILNDREDVVFFIQGNVRRYDLFSNVMMEYPIVIGYTGSHSTPQRLGYDPIRDELYCSIEEDYLLVLKGSAPELVEVYHYKDHTNWHFTYLTICRMIYDKNKDMMLFGSGHFSFFHGGSMSATDGQARLAWFDPDENHFYDIDIVRRNPDNPESNDYYILETSPYLEGLAVGNEDTLFMLDEEFEVMKDFQGIIDGVLDMECRGTELYVCARNGTFAYGLLNSSLRRIDIGTDAWVYSIEVGAKSNFLYLGTRDGIVIYDPVNGNTRLIGIDDANVTNEKPNDNTSLERLVPGGLFIDPTERFGYLCSLYPIEAFGVDLVRGKYWYMNNLTLIGSNDTIRQRVTVSKVVYSDEIGGPILITHKGLLNGSFEALLNLPTIGPLNWMYIDEKRDILYSVTGYFLGSAMCVPLPHAGKQFGLFVIDLEKGTWDVCEFRDGFPWDYVMGSTYDEYRDRFYFAGSRCFFYIDREDIDDVPPLDPIEARTIQLREEPQGVKEVIDDDEGQSKDDNIPTMIVLGSVLSILLLLILLRKQKERQIYEPREASTSTGGRRKDVR